MKDSKTKNEAVSNHLCTSVEVVSVCRVVLREPIHLCTCVSEEGGDGEVPCSEMSSLLSYTLRYVSFTEVDRSRDVDAWRANGLYTEDRGFQVPMTLDHDKPHRT
jgi:hypothetical protein